MKTLTKFLAIATVLAISATAFAHMGGGNGGFGFMHSMMEDSDSLQYQAMVQRHNDPEAMKAWMQSMIDNPEAMREWMAKVHGEDFANRKGGYGCHGYWQNSDSDENQQ